MVRMVPPDGVLGARDPESAVADQECDQFGDVVGFGGAAQRDAAEGVHELAERVGWVPPLSTAMRVMSRWAAAVRMKPGATVLTRIPCGATSVVSPLL